MSFTININNMNINEEKKEISQDHSLIYSNLFSPFLFSPSSLSSSSSSSSSYPSTYHPSHPSPPRLPRPHPLLLLSLQLLPHLSHHLI